jgi:hypothetical protein
MKLVGPIAVVVLIASALAGFKANAATSPWEQPAANLANQVAEILGPGQARLTIRNLSTVPNDEIPAIRRLLVQNLKSHGVLASGAESANSVRVTLSENSRERLWVAEIVEGNETRIAMARVQSAVAPSAQPPSGLTLRSQTVLVTSDTVLAVLEIANSLVAVEPEEIVIYSKTSGAWQPLERVAIGQKQPLPRDPRAAIALAREENGFTANLSGTVCTGTAPAPPADSPWSIRCTESDDPWTLMQPPVTPVSSENPGTTTELDPSTNNGVSTIKAFYNASRNYFTGVVSSSLGVELPPFYSGAQIVRSNTRASLLIDGIDGKVQILDGGILKPVAGTRDWGSDLASLHSGCGSGTQIVASDSGAAVTDSLRAFELPAQEAIPASAPLAMNGTVTALWTAPDSKSIFAITRDANDRYEVDRVTALCN